MARCVVLYQCDARHARHDGRARTDRSFLFQAPLLTHEGEEFLFRSLSYYRERREWHLAQAAHARSEWRAQRHEQAAQAANRMIAATRELLVESNLRLASAAAKKYASERLGFDDLFSDATMILLKAIDLFDPERGFRFSTYFVNAAMRHLNRVRRKQRLTDFDVVTTESEYLTQLSVAEDVDRWERHDEQAQGAVLRQRALNQLPERHYFVISKRCGFDGDTGKVSFESIGLQIGISKERARQLFNEGIELLRSTLKP